MSARKKVTVKSTVKSAAKLSTKSRNKTSIVDRIHELTDALGWGHPNVILQDKYGSLVALVKKEECAGADTVCSNWIEPGAADREITAMKSLEVLLRKRVDDHIACKQEEIKRAVAALKAK